MDKILPIIKPKQTFKHMALMYELDIREYGEITDPKELHQMICDSVNATQFPIMTELPSWIIMTHRQFVALLPYTSEMMDTTDRFYQTPHNVMEVEVDLETDPVSEDEVLKNYDPEVEAFEQDPVITKPVPGRWSR